MGYWPVGIFETSNALALTATLFAGPLYERLFIDGAWEDWVRLRPVSAVWNHWPSWRNLVAVSHALCTVTLFFPLSHIRYTWLIDNLL